MSEHQATAFFISSFLCESTFRINAVVAVMMIWKTFSKGILLKSSNSDQDKTCSERQLNPFYKYRKILQMFTN